MRTALALTLFSLAAGSAAQPEREGGRTTMALSVAAPLFGMADSYHLGLGVQAGRVFGRNNRRLRWRLGVEGTWFEERPPTFGSVQRGGLSVGATLDAQVRLWDGAVPVHSVVGVGAFHEQAGGHVPYAVVPEVHAGAGLAIPTGRVEIVPEIGVQVVLSDLLSGGEFTPSLRVPVRVGVRF